MGHELGVDAALPHAPGDQLGVLPAAVEHEDRPLLRRWLGDRKSDDLAH